MATGIHDPSRVLVAGRRLGRYEILTRLASGGMAMVYAARAQGVAGFERLVAIKILHANLAHEDEFIKMFLDEARLAARIRHPNVVPTIDISEGDISGYFLVMDYIEGDHLGQLLSGAHKANERLPLSVVLRVIVDALSGLGAAHDLRDEEGNSLKLVHRDVSPHNIMVGRDGVSRLTDFGVAKAEDRLTHTRDGQVKGKLAYMAPEQASTGTSDARSDLFSMGIILWECLTGRRLFRADSTAATLHKLLNDEIPPPSSVDAALAPFDPLLAKALDRDPANRFQNADEFIDALERVAAATGGLGSLRKVSRAVERYAAAKLEKDRRLIDEAIRTLKSTDPGQGFDADGVSEPSVLSAADISASSSSLSMSKLSGVYAHATSPGMQVRQRRSTLSGMGAGAPPLQVPPPAPAPLGYAAEPSEPSVVHSTSSSWARRFAWIAAVCLAAVLGWLFASDEPNDTVRVVEVPVEAAPPAAVPASPPAQPTSPAAAPVEPQAPSAAPTEAPAAKVEEPVVETPSAAKTAPAAPPKRAVTRPRVKHPTTAPSTTPPKAESRPAVEKKPETKPAPSDSTPFIPNPYKN